MKIYLSLLGQESDFIMQSKLKTWIIEKSNSDFEVIDSQTSDTYHLGVDPGAIISIVLGSGAVIQLAKALHTWIIATRPKFEIKIEKEDRTFITIKADNYPDLLLIVQKLEEFLIKDKT